MRPYTFLDVDNCGNVDMRREHLGLDKTQGEQHYARNLGVRPRGERAFTEYAADLDDRSRGRLR